MLYNFHLHRRAKLIAAALPPVKAAPLEFKSNSLTKLLASPLGSWTLIEPNLILASSDCSSPVPNGEYIFVENKLDPPNRAYLKLWEFFTRTGKRPAKGERCIDLGASPGGWSWVLASLGANVTAIDKASLAYNVAKDKRVMCHQRNMFSVTAEELRRFDWIFSDAACEPDKLLKWIQSWIAKAPDSSIVCTLKFKGSGPYDVIREFLKILGGHVVHLTANKHEVTWYRIRN